MKAQSAVAVSRLVGGSKLENSSLLSGSLDAVLTRAKAHSRFLCLRLYLHLYLYLRTCATAVDFFSQICRSLPLPLHMSVISLSFLYRQ
jgi:hypothetical protein